MELLGMGSGAFYSRLKRSARLQEELARQRGILVDEAESQLLQQVRMGVLPAIIFVLKTLGKERGYVERTEVTGAGGGEIKVIHVRARSELRRQRRLGLHGGEVGGVPKNGPRSFPEPGEVEVEYEQGVDEDFQEEDDELGVGGLVIDGSYRPVEE
jgi:hypothetical protein